MTDNTAPIARAESIFHEALRRAEAEGRSDGAAGLTFVSDGPHGLPIRPHLLSVDPSSDRRVYSATVRQVRKVVRLLDERSNP